MAAIEQRMRQKLLHDLTSASFPTRARCCQRSLGMLSLRNGAKISKINMDQTRSGEEAVDRANRLGNEIIRDSECIDEACIFIDQSEDLLVCQTNHRIGGLLQLFKAKLGLALTPGPFTIER